MHQNLETATLYTQNAAQIRSYLFRLTGCREAASDLLHDVFVRLLGQTRADIRSPKAFLLKAARNIAIDHQRRAKTMATAIVFDEPAAAIAYHDLTAERIISAREQLSALVAALDALPPRPAQIFRLARVEALTYGQIAHRLQVSESTVQKDLALALAQIMTRLDLDRAGSPAGVSP
ncbi:MAG: RNA polymerase sigma factor, partial [Pseudomonadota bacterium]